MITMMASFVKELLNVLVLTCKKYIWYEEYSSNLCRWFWYSNEY